MMRVKCKLVLLTEKTQTIVQLQAGAFPGHGVVQMGRTEVFLLKHGGIFAIMLIRQGEEETTFCFQQKHEVRLQYILYNLATISFKASEQVSFVALE